MYVKLYKLDNKNEEVSTFAEGSHVLGRGVSLQCDDKRISRNHATLTVTKEGVKLTSIHINPCFLKVRDSKNISILSQGSSSDLNDGDIFAFLPEDNWFKIRLFFGEENLTVDTKVPKRISSSTAVDEPPDKKLKLSVDSINVDKENIKKALEESSRKQEEENNCKYEETNEATVQNANETEHTTLQKSHNEVECGDNELATVEHKVDENEQNNVNRNEIEAENDKSNEQELDKPKEKDDNENDASPSSSHPKPRRERCWYGAACYRKNPVHRQEYTHPGDSDFESDPEDNRPSCSYGAACYRKNKDHRRLYKHPSQNKPRKNGAKKETDIFEAANDEDINEVLGEMSDSEDPFINDDDSDDFVADTDEDDSDWEDSQENEDPENVKRLVKEAKRFVKK